MKLVVGFGPANSSHSPLGIIHTRLMVRIRRTKAGGLYI